MGQGVKHLLQQPYVANIARPPSVVSFESRGVLQIFQSLKLYVALDQVQRLCGSADSSVQWIRMQREGSCLLSEQNRTTP